MCDDENWEWAEEGTTVWNTLTANGTIVDIVKLRRDVSKPYRTRFDTPPSGRNWEQKGDFLLWNCRRPSEEQLSAYWSYPFHWRARHWSTRWEIAEPRTLKDSSRQHLVYQFETEEQPPLSAIQQLSADFPGVSFTLHAVLPEHYEVEFGLDEGNITVVYSREPQEPRVVRQLVTPKDARACPLGGPCVGPADCCAKPGDGN